MFNVLPLVFHLQEIQQEFLLGSWCPDSDRALRAQTPTLNKGVAFGNSKSVMIFILEIGGTGC